MRWIKAASEELGGGLEWHHANLWQIAIESPQRSKAVRLEFKPIAMTSYKYDHFE
jgi:hypothetical protein